MNKKEALKKLKKFWEEHSGKDYLDSLISLKREMSPDHKSFKALEEEIEKIKLVHEEFVIWKDKKDKKKKVKK